MNYSEHEKIVLPLTLLGIIIFVSIITLALRGKSRRVRNIPTATVAVCMLFIEIVKQRWHIFGDYDAFFLPFHYCSLFVPVYILAELCGKRLSLIFRPIGVCMSFIITCAMYVYPSGIMGNACEEFGKVFNTTHSFIFHHLVILYLLLTIALNLSRPRIKDAIAVGIVGVVYLSIALPLSYILDTNYNNLLRSVIPILEEFRLAYGQVPYTVVICLSMTVGMTLGSLIYIGIQKLFVRVFSLRKNKIEKISQ